MKSLRTVFALGIDVLVGAYVTSACLFIIMPAMISDSISIPSPYGAISVSIGSILTLILSVGSKVSLGRAVLYGQLPTGRARSIQRHLAWITFVVTVISGWIVTEISPIEFFSGQGLAGAGRIFGALFTPEFDIIGEALSAMMETVFTAFMATIIAVPVSFVLSFAAARNVMATDTTGRIVYVVLRALLNIMRSMEPIIWAIIFSVWVGIGPFAGMLALVVHTIASLTKQYSEQIEDVNDGPIEAISATGASRLQVLWFAIVPQCVIPFLSFTIYRWDINVRMATIIGFVGGGGIGYLLTQYQGLSRYHEVGMLVIIITAVVWILDVISARVRAALK